LVLSKARVRSGRRSGSAVRLRILPGNGKLYNILSLVVERQYPMIYTSPIGTVSRSDITTSRTNIGEMVCELNIPRTDCVEAEKFLRA